MAGRLDNPGVSCDECYAALDLDGIVPPCRTGEGCWIVPLTSAGSRVVEMHGLLLRLGRLNVGGEILRMYRATPSDLMALAVIEDELNPREGSNNGPGPEVATEC